MRDYYAEYLQIKNSANTSDRAVSKVSKGQIKEEKHTSDTFDTALPSEHQKITASEKIIKKCSNCGLEMNLIENDKIWFCPLGCETYPVTKSQT
jgi:tRNA G26 N,N-dimethylase Trm1